MAFPLRLFKNLCSEKCMYIWSRPSIDRVCCLYRGDVELPSDMHGIVYVPFKDSVEEARDMIIKELREAGYKI